MASYEEHIHTYKILLLNEGLRGVQLNGGSMNLHCTYSSLHGNCYWIYMVI